MDTFKELHHYLTEYTQFYMTVVDFEVKKLSAILNNDLKEIEKNILLQQAFLMKIEAKERGRLKFTQSLGFDNQSLKVIIDGHTGVEKAQLTKIYDDLSQIILDIQHYNKKSMELAQMNLKLFQTDAMKNEEASSNLGSW